MEEKRSNKGLYIVIIVLVAVICLLVGFIFGKGLLTENNKNNDQEISENNNESSKEEDKIVSISEEQGKPFFEKIGVYNDYFSDVYSSGKIQNKDNNYILYFLVKKLEGFGTGLDKNGFTVADLKKVANQYFTDDIEITYTDILDPVLDDNYVEYKLGADGKYLKQSVPAHDGPGHYIMENYYIDGIYNETKDEYTINTKLLFNQFCDGSCGPHDKFYSDVKLENIVYTNTAQNFAEFDDVYEIVKDRLPVTSYKFVKNSSGNYVLSSVIVK